MNLWWFLFLIFMGVLLGWLVASIMYHLLLQEYKKRVEYLQYLLTLGDDRDD